MAPVYITIDPEATGRNIRLLMRQHGYDIDDVREACGNVSPQAVYKWLSGKSLPSIDNLKILSVIFGTTMEGILVTDENAHVFCLFGFCFFHLPPSYFLIFPLLFPFHKAFVSFFFRISAYFRDLTMPSSSRSQSDLSE